MTSLDQEFHVSIHERDGHGNGRSVRKDEIGVLAELLDHTEDVIPPPTVQPRAVITEFVDDLQPVSEFSHSFHYLLTSSISNAATMVSISTVPRIVPRGILM